MQCPRCITADLTDRDRSGVQIDVCTTCRGVWLDRGELEKLISLATRNHDERDDGDHADDDDDDDRRRTRREGAGRRSWWDIFD